MDNNSPVQNKPTVAYNWSLAGSIIGILASMSFIVIAVDAAQGMPYDVVSNNYYILYGLGVWCFVACCVIIYAARKLNSRPLEHSKWGAVILVFSIISVGGILSIVGGILALAYKPEFVPLPQQAGSQLFMPQQNIGPEYERKACSQCGQVMGLRVRFCPNCGSSTYIKPQAQSGLQASQASAYEPRPYSEKITQFCGNCGTRLEPGIRFCPECGQSTS